MANSSTTLTTSKRILIFSTAYLPLIGGAEIAVKEITDRIADIEFDLVTLRFSKTHPNFERIGNVNVYRIGGGLGYFSKILFVIQAALLARKRSYAAYWCIMTYMLFPAVLSRKAPWVLTLQDGDPFEHVFNRWFIRPFRPLLSYGMKHAAQVQAISTYLATWSGREDAIVIPNGVDVEKFKNPRLSRKNKDEVILITTSRLVEKNAVGDIIESLKFLPENVKLRIIGTGELERDLKSRVLTLGLESRVAFLGSLPPAEIPKHLHEADIFVRPSLSEGMGNSFIEAMAAGIPVIGTPVGGIVDFLHDGETGLMVEPKSPRLIAFQVQKLMSDRVLRDKITIAAGHMVEEKYDWDLIAREMRNKVFNTL